MPRDARYDVLFEPVQIGPVVARNRFYQVPHSTGMGHVYPKASASFRGMKAEGGWGVVCTGACEIHYSADYNRAYDRIWDDEDVASHRHMVDLVHQNNALAGIELSHSTFAGSTFYTRSPTIGPDSLRSTHAAVPFQSRRMDLTDIREYRKSHRDAAVRAKKAGFDIVYVYAAHGPQLPYAFLNRRFNNRNDEYGGSFENRARLLKEVLSDTKEAIGGSCAIALRFSVDELLGTSGIEFESEGRDLVEYLADVPDLWDVNLGAWPNDSVSSRFAQEGYQEKYVSFVKQITSKPVVGVGRFTSPDTMVSQIKRGILDFIGAARPSIADPFLPKKIEEGRIEDIRECIGCNVCVSLERVGGPIQCTQNPTVGEEYRRAWHPEKMSPRHSDSRILVVGSGPAGMECAMSLGRRGYEVAIAEKKRELGGRVIDESKLPGLSAWKRVSDYRLHQLEKLPSVEIYRESELDAENALNLGFGHIVVATGSHWRRDGIAATSRLPIPGLNNVAAFTPDDVMAGIDLLSPVLVYDDDHNYMASVLCELLRQQGKEVILVTPLAEVAAWTYHTMEQGRIWRRLYEQNVEVITNFKLSEVRQSSTTISCVHSSATREIEFKSVLLVTSREPNDALYNGLHAKRDQFADCNISGLYRIGDCLAPGLIANAVFSGHEFARNFDSNIVTELPFIRER